MQNKEKERESSFSNDVNLKFVIRQCTIFYINLDDKPLGIMP